MLAGPELLHELVGHRVLVHHLLLHGLHDIVGLVVPLLLGFLLLNLLLNVDDSLLDELLRLVLDFLGHINSHLERLALGLHLDDLVGYRYEHILHLVAAALAESVLPLLLLKLLPLHLGERAVIHSYQCNLLVDVASVIVRLEMMWRLIELRPIEAILEIVLAVLQGQRLLLPQHALVGAVPWVALGIGSTGSVHPRLGRRMARQVFGVILIVIHLDLLLINYFLELILRAGEWSSSHTQQH